MLLRTKGIAFDIHEPIVGRVTKNGLNQGGDQILILQCKVLPTRLADFSAVITTASRTERILDKPSVYELTGVDHLSEGDIIVLNQDGMVNTLFRPKSHQNFLLFTERCNSNCLMCSQPPKNRNDGDYLYNIHSKLIPMIPKDCTELGITGGEPTLLGEKYFSLLQLLQSELPETEIHCLTNGRSFAWSNIAGRLGALHFSRLMLGIPLYADHSSLHDYIVQAEHAFDQTMTGLYKLAAVDQRIEIRIVLHKQTIPRLVKLAKFIYRNLPFVEHIAFMGLENQGYTPHNLDLLWIDPADYINELSEAVQYLAQMRMNVSIYNSQLCLLPESLWPFNRRSISDWKNIYLEKCSSCKLIKECGGLFASCANMHSKFLTPFL